MAAKESAIEATGPQGGLAGRS
ncbi:hypothetical protein AA100600_2267 [Gluconobacter thailandicus F149-1 = NBRC 100600]|nr:hypothetical protein AA100600_2267 [Gluconobacter thailandicus F149-1 = NBRC 100600]